MSEPLIDLAIDETPLLDLSFLEGPQGKTGERGPSGVYYGTKEEDIPKDATVWVNPLGAPADLKGDAATITFSHLFISDDGSYEIKQINEENPHDKVYSITIPKGPPGNPIYIEPTAVSIDSNEDPYVKITGYNTEYKLTNLNKTEDEVKNEDGTENNKIYSKQELEFGIPKGEIGPPPELEIGTINVVTRKDPQQTHEVILSKKYKDGVEENSKNFTGYKIDFNIVDPEPSKINVFGNMVMDDKDTKISFETDVETKVEEIRLDDGQVTNVKHDINITVPYDYTEQIINKAAIEAHKIITDQIESITQAAIAEGYKIRVSNTIPTAEDTNDKTITFVID